MKTDTDQDPAVADDEVTSAVKKGGGQRPFPAATFEESLPLAEAIFKHGSGMKVRRLTIFDQMDRSPESGPSRQLIVNSGRYGLTNGGVKAEHLELTPRGRLVVDPETTARSRAKAKFELAIESIAPFKSLYEELQGKKVPSKQIMTDLLEELDVAGEFAEECVEAFLLNARHVGILRVVSGAERIVTLEHLLDELPGVSERKGNATSDRLTTPPNSEGAAKWETVCFFIAPIGEPESIERQHSDLFLGAIVEPALAQFSMRVVRADQIDDPGMISRQILEHIVKAKIVIADLSFHNPNVYYELCLRHACRKPVIHIARTGDKIPFDIKDFRTVVIDTSSLYSFVPQLETYKAELVNKVRKALDPSTETDNPISTFFPELRVTLPEEGGELSRANE